MLTARRWVQPLSETTFSRHYSCIGRAGIAPSIQLWMALLLKGFRKYLTAIINSQRVPSQLASMPWSPPHKVINLSSRWHLGLNSFVCFLEVSHADLSRPRRPKGPICNSLPTRLAVQQKDQSIYRYSGPAVWASGHPGSAPGTMWSNPGQLHAKHVLGIYSNHCMISGPSLLFKKVIRNWSWGKLNVSKAQAVVDSRNLRLLSQFLQECSLKGRRISISCLSSLSTMNFSFLPRPAQPARWRSSKIAFINLSVHESLKDASN